MKKQIERLAEIAADNENTIEEELEYFKLSQIMDLETQGDLTDDWSYLDDN